MQASNEEATVRSFGVPHRIRNAICPASTGIVSGVRGVGGLKLKLGTSRFAHARRPFFFVYMPVRNTNITNTTNNAHECCSTCVRPLVECQHTSRTRKRLTSKPRTVPRVSPTHRRHPERFTGSIVRWCPFRFAFERARSEEVRPAAGETVPPFSHFRESTRFSDADCSALSPALSKSIVHC